MEDSVPCPVSADTLVSSVTGSRITVVMPPPGSTHNSGHPEDDSRSSEQATAAASNAIRPAT
jgi:hypothetical protein